MSFLLLTLKTLLCCMYAIIVRGTVPRYRFDQLIHLNWKHFVFLFIGYFLFNFLGLLLFL